MLREDVALDPNDALVHYLRVTMHTLGEIVDEIATAYRPVNADAAPGSTPRPRHHASLPRKSPPSTTPARPETCPAMSGRRH
ncbi:hypothetical protein Athai_61190 [Actinocatenispora thailandica]|uniref:Uncharacterized protein n=1 Tax=Actinocatenispora thailandica TaxID=227318 RepID=A0A7R7I0H7_9ACTN|nr:hypothetical protein [Actinocatenispora thailandica]BCJ38616.1 hypothetical protein Athai_61190 [Actinocatenispora thailandica]